MRKLRRDPGTPVRVSHEKRALEPFRALAKKHGCEVFEGQNSKNIIGDLVKGAPRVCHQFGDLRVKLKKPERFLIVEVESAGGVTNLAKYWECYEKGRIKEPMKLLHLFRKNSANDYKAHRMVWEFLCEKMQKAHSTTFEARLLTYNDPADMAQATELFEAWLEGR